VKSYLFTTEDGRGGVILCDINTMEEVVPYLQQRFKGVVRVEQGHREWTANGGFAQFTPRPISEISLGGEQASLEPLNRDHINAGEATEESASPTGSLF